MQSIKTKVQKERFVKTDSDLLIGNIHFKNAQTVNITDFTCLDPHPPFSLPNVFVNMFCTQFVQQKQARFLSLADKKSKKGFIGSQYEKYIKNPKNNKNLELF